MSDILAKVKVQVEALRWTRWWWWWCWPNNDGSGGCFGGGYSRDGAIGFVGTGSFGTTWWP